MPQNLFNNIGIYVAATSVGCGPKTGYVAATLVGCSPKVECVPGLTDVVPSHRVFRYLITL